MHKYIIRKYIFHDFLFSEHCVLSYFRKKIVEKIHKYIKHNLNFMKNTKKLSKILNVIWDLNTKNVLNNVHEKNSFFLV